MLRPITAIFTISINIYNKALLSNNLLNKYNKAYF